ncbi:hypothetical protein DRP07_07565 [Archaeoglobales archaeon]|nr:MAG: hypothetical protein DRP07_07565 [Archaeoglobales archaeon]
MENFIRDIDSLIERLSKDLNRKEVEEILELRKRLIELKKRRMVNIAHSVMELIVGKYLLKRGYRIEVEYNLNSISCDVYGEKGMGNITVEIETGYIPPYHALDPQRYLRARIASKIARYSNFCSKFVIGIPQHYLMPLEKIFLLPPRKRSKVDLERVKELCDIYYTSPPVSLEEIKNARIHSVYIINVDALTIKEIDPETYYEMYKTNLKVAEDYAD